MHRPISGFGNVSSKVVAEAAGKFGTPLYLYDEQLLRKRCKEVRAMPSAFLFSPRYAMKANPNKAILQVIAGEGLDIDASSLNEAGIFK